MSQGDPDDPGAGLDLPPSTGGSDEHQAAAAVIAPGSHLEAELRDLRRAIIQKVLARRGRTLTPAGRAALQQHPDFSRWQLRHVRPELLQHPDPGGDRNPPRPRRPGHSRFFARLLRWLLRGPRGG